MSDTIHEIEHLDEPGKLRVPPTPIKDTRTGKAIAGVSGDVIGVDGGKIVNDAGLDKVVYKVGKLVRAKDNGWPSTQYQSAWKPPSIEDTPLEHDGAAVKDFTKPKDQLLFKMMKGMQESRLAMLRQVQDDGVDNDTIKKLSDN